MQLYRCDGKKKQEEERPFHVFDWTVPSWIGVVRANERASDWLRMNESESEKEKNALIDENVSTQIDRIFWKSGSCFKGTNQHKRYTLLFYVRFRPDHV